MQMFNITSCIKLSFPYSGSLCSSCLTIVLNSTLILLLVLQVVDKSLSEHKNTFPGPSYRAT